MAAKRLPPMTETPDLWDEAERELLKAIRRKLYLPLLREILPDRAEDDVLRARNALDDVVVAVMKGEVQFLNGHFEGTFRAAISRELRRMGATYDRRRKWWSIPFRELPPDVRVAIGTAQSRFRAMAERANRALGAVVPEEVAAHVDLGRMFDQSVFRMDKQFRKNVAKIGVVPELSPGVKRSIAEEYLRSTKLDIADWTRREISSLRKRVQANTFEYGLRREALLKTIETQYGQTARRAKFIARQETSLIMAKFQQARYAEVGIRKYIWKCVNNPPRWITGPDGGRKLAPHSVRPDHWKLNDSEQLWSSRPVVDEATGRRCHPKEDFNCRCTAIPVVD